MRPPAIGERNPAARLLDWLGWVALAALGVRTAGAVLVVTTASERLPQWDMAKYGAAGLRLARAVAGLDPLAAVATVHGSSVVPPLFFLVEAPAFLTLGPDYRVARALVGALLLVAVAAAAWAGRRLDPVEGPLIGALAATLLATSPFAQVLASVVLLEVPGMALLLLAVGTYVRATSSDRPRDLRPACLAAAALFFLKYNYGLLWLAPMLLAEAWRDAGTLRELGRRARRALGRIDPRRPLHALLAAVALVTAALWLTGPWRLPLPGGGTRSVSSAGNLAYGAYLLTLLALAVRPRRSAGRLRAWWATRGPRTRTVVLWIGLPIGLWLLAPSHTRDLLEFVHNRSSDMTPLTPAALLYYPRLLVSAWSASTTVGAVALALASGCLLALPRLPARVRPPVVALLVGLAAVLLHPYKLPRFLSPVAPLVWLCAAWAAAHGVAALILPARRALAMRVLALAVPLVAIAGGPVDRGWIRHQHELRTVPATTAPALDAVCAEAAAGDGSVLLDYWNELSPGLVEWHCARTEPALPAARLPRLLRAGERRGDVPSRLAGDRRADTVLVLDAAPGSPLAGSGFAAETAWLQELRPALAGDPRFRLRATLRFPDSGYILRVYRVRR